MRTIHGHVYPMTLIGACWQDGPSVPQTISILARRRILVTTWGAEISRIPLSLNDRLGSGSIAPNRLDDVAGNNGSVFPDRA